MVNNILVAAPGTMLSSVGQKLSLIPSVQIFDVEAILLDSLDGQDGRIVHKNRNRGSRPIDMGVVCRSFTREIVIDKWQKSVSTGLDQFSPDSHNILTCHLTLFRNDRSEYYSTLGPLLMEVQKSGQVIDNVVVLIDDIYDMYSRLTKGDGALNAEAKAGRWSEFTKKATPKTLMQDNRGEVSQGFKSLLKLETVAQTLSQISSWRHVELLNAESTAIALGARLSVLGVKHKTSALQSLVTLPNKDVQTVYISHPISSYRRSVNQELLSGSTYSWVPAVSECNTIPDHLLPHGLVALMPTAIDELRFRPIPSTASSLYDRPSQLGPRWPLMTPSADLMISHNGDSFVDEDVQHASILTPDSEAATDGTRQLAGGIVRSIEGLVHAEIPYRDHLLVASSDHLFVFRPLENMGRLSGGVHNEVRHWDNKVTFGNKNSRLVVLHSFDDLTQIGQMLIPDKKSEGISPTQAELASLESVLEKIEGYAKSYIVEDHDVTIEEASQVLDGKALVGDHLGGHPRLEFADGVASATREAVRFALEKYLRVRLGISVFGVTKQAAIAFADNHVRLTANRLSSIAEFMRTPHEGLADSTLIHIGDESSDSYIDSRNLLQSALVIEGLLGYPMSQDYRAPGTLSETESQEMIASDWFQRFKGSLATLKAQYSASQT